MLRKLIGERGSAFVEAAIALPILLAFIFGIIQFGSYLTALITLRNAASIAARTAILPYPSNTQQNVERLAERAIDSFLDPTKLRVDIDDAYEVDGFGATKIDLSYNYDLIIKKFIPGASTGTITIRASTVMR